MSTETIRRCDECRAIIPPTVPHFALEFIIVPMRDLVTLGNLRSAKGEFCGAECVQKRIAETLTPQRPAEMAA